MKGKNDSEGLTVRLWVATSVCIIIERPVSRGFSRKKESGRNRKFNIFKRSAKPSKIVKEWSYKQAIKREMRVVWGFLVISLILLRNIFFLKAIWQCIFLYDIQRVFVYLWLLKAFHCQIRVFLILSLGAWSFRKDWRFCSDIILFTGVLLSEISRKSLAHVLT